MPLRGVRTPKLPVILECGLKWHSDCWSAECQLRCSAKWHTAILHSTGWSAQPECILFTPALQSAIHSGTPTRTSHSRLHLVWIRIWGENWIGVRGGVSTPIQLMEWSAVWSAAVRTPKIIVDWSVDCTPKIFGGLECGLHSKKTGVPKGLRLIMIKKGIRGNISLLHAYYL